MLRLQGGAAAGCGACTTTSIAALLCAALRCLPTGQSNETPCLLCCRAPLCVCVQGDCSTTDPYADYAGTLRGVMEGGCDVAFTKHTVPMQYAKDGSEPEAWASKNKVGGRGGRAFHASGTLAVGWMHPLSAAASVQSGSMCGRPVLHPPARLPACLPACLPAGRPDAAVPRRRLQVCGGVREL